MWGEHPLFSTFCALILMVVLQTLALGFDQGSFGAWIAMWMRNWINILRNNATIGIIALGMTFVIITGGIDLAVGSTLVAIGAVVMVFIDGSSTGILTSIGITGPLAYLIGILMGLIAGFLLGQFTGILVTLGKLPPFIATLGMMKICRSVTQQVMQTANPSVPMGFTKIANLTIGRQMFMPIIYWLIIAFIMYYISKNTAFGRHVFAVGSNERAAKLSGINTMKVKRWVYTIMGLLVAVAAVLQVSRIGAMDYANAGSGYEMDAIAAVIVGGTSMAGGRGSIGGTVLGVLIIAVMNNLLNLLGVPPFLREAFKGVVVIAAVLLQKKEKV
ncbi:MAG TPA: ABC transporter permease [Candidatus Ornithospirochaeta avicola]|uniref:ABC transporter permease n=1 Tax=Candidatus Ornithospirochaeta avicola TaxID=2840896 RepID=A0A9D1PTZ8_9SPIO|nr:ABC transporter permease [Candidatus Ornithospirochaeta avicola]